MSTNNKYLNTLSQSVMQTTNLYDTDSPLSYKDWYKYNRNIVLEESFKQYNAYLTNYYTRKKQITPEFNSQIRQKYINLLENLQVYFSNTEAEEWYKYVNFEDEKELLVAIPYFARKLKDIALYYLQLREEVKKSKIKYNTLGTNTGTILQLQEQLLNLFAKKNNEQVNVSSDVWKNIPELSSIKNTFTVSVEELYDDHTYFDQTASLPVTSYYDFTNKDFINVFNTKGLSLSDNTWLYSQGTFGFDENNLFSALSFAENLLTEYTSENKYALFSDGESTTTETDTYNIFIGEGNNVFYWPYGFYQPDMSTIKRYEPINLQDAGFESLGTGGDSVLNSDTIFVTTAQGIEGAWLYYKEFEEYVTTLKAYLQGGKKTAFRYPLPGYGLSGEDIAWTGPSLQFTPEYNYLRPDIKQSVTEAYWNFDNTLSGTRPISINSTTLIEQGAYPSEKYPLADKIKIGNYTPFYGDPAYYGDMQEVWLYKMTKTDIPIGVGLNLFFWPYERIETDSSFPTYYPSDVFNVCQPVSLTSVPLPFSTSSDTIETADIIYRVPSYEEATIEDAIECAWLSGKKIDYSVKSLTSIPTFLAWETIGIQQFFTETINSQNQVISQPGLNVLFSDYSFTSFIWEGPDFTNINEVFKTFSHQPDCGYLINNADHTDPELCTCKQTYFTPFGHPGTTYDEYFYLGDFIVEGQNFKDLLEWKDIYNTSYTTSSAFGWYKTDKKIGWGYGSWYAKGNLSDASSNTPFYLRHGRQYTYYRGGPYETETTPTLTVRYPYSNSNTVWVKAVKNEDNVWISTDTISDMVLQPGNLYLYEKTSQATFYTLSSNIVSTNISIQENRGSVWADYDYVSIGANSENNINQVVNITYPSVFYSVSLSALDSQFPAIPYGNILSIDWYLTTPENITTKFTNKNSFSFAPNIPGTYSISFIAITANNILPFSTYTSEQSGYYSFNAIPSITAVNPSVSSVATILSGVNTPTNGFTINCPLYGWNYNTNKPDAKSLGARPYWAASSTLYRDINSWGAAFRLIDGSNILTQPPIANVFLQQGGYLEYNRVYPTSFLWSQPIIYQNYINKNIWLELQIDTNKNSNFEGILNNLTNQVVIKPLSTLSPIILKNDIDNQPVEIFYKAINGFNWNITTTPIIQTYSTPTLTIEQITNIIAPWTNLTNRFYPTVAVLPALDELYSEKETGGFFTTNKLGASIYLSNYFNSSVSTSGTGLTGLFTNSNFCIGGRGLTKTDQPGLLNNIKTNNTWLKDPIVSAQSAGNIKKDVSKKYQKFIPYQSLHENNLRAQNGLVLPQSRQSPWGGVNDTLWTDLGNKPETPTGILNVDAWAESQVLKQNSKALDNWTTDIFGNQYGLYKNLNNLPVYQRKTTPGELWVRKNSQAVQPGNVALSSVFSLYQTLPFYSQLTGNGILKIDCFFDTLYIETTGSIILDNINYNFDTNTIYSIKENAQGISLAMPVKSSLTREFSGVSLDNSIYAKPGETWFFPKEKNIIISVCGLSSGHLYPELYKYDIATRELYKVFPNRNDTIYINSLSSNNFQSFEPPVLTYNTEEKQYVLTLLCKNGLNLDTFIELTMLDDGQKLNLDKITLYNSNNAPISSLVPPVVNQNLLVNATNNVQGTFQAIALNNPTTFSITDPRFGWISVSNTGLFTFTPPTTGNYFVPFVVSNNNGPAYYSLNINVT